MQLEQQASDADWTGTVPAALDARLVAFVVGVAGLAASLNVPYGGPVAAGAAFVLLVIAGTAAHVAGERRLRRLTDDLVDRWVAEGGRVNGVTRADEGLRTEWTVHTAEGPVTIGGLALAPISRLTIDWQGTGDELPAADAAEDLDALADDWYREVFELS